jgi:hypothetical protein
VDTGNDYQLLQDIDGAPPRGALPVCPTASTTEVGDDIDGGPLWALLVVLTASTTDFEDDVDGRPLGGTTGGSDSVHHRG